MTEPIIQLKKIKNEILFKNILKEKSKKKRITVIIYVLCHSGNDFEATVFCNKMNKECDRGCTYRKHRLKQSKYFENEFYFWWLENSKTELLPSVRWIGAVVPHYKTKTKEDIDFYEISRSMGNKDFYSFRGSPDDCLNTHPGGMFLLNKTLEKIGLVNSNINNMRVTYFNYWLMSVNALNDYSNYIELIRSLWENDISLSSLMNKNSMYPLTKLNSQQLMNKIGFPHYTFHTFILERLHKIILTSLGYICDNDREYNPDMIITNMNDTEDTEDIDDIINNIKSKNTFVLNSDRTINYTVGDKISKTINLVSGETLIPVFT